jgi:hypothetical protein
MPDRLAPGLNAAARDAADQHPLPPGAIEPHLFRREAGRIVATLTRLFGVHNLAG